MTVPVQDRYEWLIGHLRAGTFDERSAAEGFGPRFLAVVPAAALVEVMASVAPVLLGEPASTAVEGRSLEVQYATVTALALVEEAEPYRFEGLELRPKREPITDARLREPPWTSEGDPSRIENALREEFRAQDMVGVVAAGSDDGGHTQQWAVGAGFADLDAGIEVQSQQPMLAGSIMKLLTATAALQLVGEGLIRVDDSANRYLQSLRLESDTVTVRHLLTHTAGVSSAFEPFCEVVPTSPAEVLGDVVHLDFEPGTRWEYSNGGYAVLGEVMSAAAGRPYTDVITERVLEPLRMTSSTLATSWPRWLGPGYEAVVHGRPVPVPRKVPSVLAAGGLLTTVGDLLKFVAGWRSLLPAELAEEALRPQAELPDGHQGFGWLLTSCDGRAVAGHTGGVLGYASSLLWLPDDSFCTVLIANRNVDAEQANTALLRTMAGR